MLRLFKFIYLYREAARFAKLDPEALQLAGAEAGRHRSYHRRIVWISLVTAVVVSAVATFSFWTSNEERNKRDADLLTIVPLSFGAVGMLLGLAVACLFAPTEFLRGPVGSKWMALIGTKNTASARAVCGIVALMLFGVVAFVAVADKLVARGILPAPKLNASHSNR